MAIEKLVVNELGVERILFLGDTLPAETDRVSVDVWRRVVDETGKPLGSSRRVAGRPVVEVVRDLERRLLAEDLVDEYFTLGTPYKYPQTRKPYVPSDWPERYRAIACYVVTGGSEGHYVHVDLVIENGKFGTEADDLHICIAMVKTFLGMDHAWKVAARCAELLGS